MRQTLAIGVIVLFGLGSPAAAQDGTANALKAYVAKILPTCPDGSLTVEDVQGGPASFRAFVATLRSSDSYCGSQKYVLYSASSHQVLLGTVIPLPESAQPASERIAAEATRLLGKPMTAVIAPYPLADGLRSVAISRPTPYGPFAYNGYVDAAERYLIIGLRGNLKTDPATTLRDALSATVARRGNAAAKVEILEITDFQCPTCARAHLATSRLLQSNLPNISHGFINLPLFEHHEWAIPAAMAGRAIHQVAPASFWLYVDEVFAQQETIGKAPFDVFLTGFVAKHRLNRAAVDKIYNSASERRQLLDQVSRAFGAGIASTPTFIVNGQIVGFGPDGSFTLDAIRRAIDGR